MNGVSLSSLRSRRTRFAVYVAIALVLLVPLAFQAATADAVLDTGTETGEPSQLTSTPPASTDTPGGNGTDGTESPTDGGTEPTDDGVVVRDRSGVLVTVQSYGGFGENNGRAVIVEDGEVVWQFAPENSRVFDAEMLENGNVLVSYATRLSASDCPADELEVDEGACVKNNVVELEYDSKRVVWEYRWYDEFISHHEVHDSDRLESGETAIIDMGNDRAFTVNETGAITWEWSAVEHLGPGSAYWEEYGAPSEPSPESDWTHMNDIDQLENGNFLMSIRNFDVLIEVNRSTDEVVDVVGEPRDTEGDVEGREPILDDQHNPMMLANGTILVADSEADRIVEVNASTNEVVWTYAEDLVWPRDADRLPNGNTLVTNSLGYSVREITPDGEIVWEYQVSWNGQRGIPYEADRISIPEEPDSMPSIDAVRSGGGTDGTTTPTNGTAVGTTTAGGGESESGDGIGRYERFLLLYLPAWMGTFDVLLAVGVLLAVTAGAIDALVYAGKRAREEIATRRGSE